MKIFLSADFIRQRVPEFADNFDYHADLDSQSRLTISVSHRGPIAVARWNSERQVLEGTSGPIHTDPFVSDKLYKMLEGAIKDQEKATSEKIAQIHGLLDQHGFPPVRDGNFGVYVSEFSESVRTILLDAMRAHFLGDEQAAHRAFAEAVRRLKSENKKSEP